MSSWGAIAVTYVQRSGCGVRFPAFLSKFFEKTSATLNVWLSPKFYHFTIPPLTENRHVSLQKDVEVPLTVTQEKI